MLSANPIFIFDPLMGISKSLQIHEQNPVQTVWFLAENGPYFRPSRWLLNIIDFRTRQTFCCLNLNFKKCSSVWSAAGWREFENFMIASDQARHLCAVVRGVLKIKQLLVNITEIWFPKVPHRRYQPQNDIFWVKEKWITRCSTSHFSQGVIG